MYDELKMLVIYKKLINYYFDMLDLYINVSIKK